MKTSTQWFGIRSLSLSLSLSLTVCAQAPPLALESARESASFQVAERGPHHRTWQKILTTTDAQGRVVSQTNLAYIELATGMHYLENGQWREAQEVIESFPDGAIARRGAHRVIFANTLNVAGVVDLQMPDGRRVRSHLLGLAWWDAASGKGVLVGGIKECAGKLLPPNQVLYADAFEGVKADVRYTYTRAGLEQDVILRECPPGPERFGLDPKTTRLQVWTEFVEAPEARVEEVAVATKDGRQARDVWVDWGSMAIGPGRAFAVGEAAGEEDKLPDAEGTGSVRVSKQWVKIEGRQFLVEEVEWGAVRAAVERLPAAQEARAGEERVGPVAMWLPAAPPKRAAKREATPMQVAQAAQLGQGFVVDYVVLNTTQNNYTFRGDTTYFISAQVNLNGTTTFEGGAVIKFRRSNSGLRLNGPWVCRTGPYRPVIFTAQDDNTVGETIAGSTGTPTGYYGNGVRLTKAGAMSQVRFAHLGLGVAYEPWGAPNNPKAVQLTDVQWVRCQLALRVVDAWCMVCGATVYVDNALVAQCPTFLEGEEAFVHARHVTVDQCSTLASCLDGECSLAMTNSILSSVTTFTSGGATVTGSHNAFTSQSRFGANDFNAPQPLFESVGAGHYYLAVAQQNDLRNRGTPNLPDALLDALAEKTVSPPVVHQNVQWNQDLTLTTRSLGDTDGQPDLGYHYDVLDYLVRNVAVASATLRLCDGVAVGIASAGGEVGIRIQDNGVLLSEGTPRKLNCIVRYNAVQEQPSSGLGGTGIGGLIGTGVSSLSGRAELRFTMLAGQHELLGTFGLERVQLRDCQMYNGRVWVHGYYPDIGVWEVVNCLLVRMHLGYTFDAVFAEFYNNTFFGGEVLLDLFGDSSFLFRDNFFDRTALWDTGGAIDRDYNGYIEGYGWNPGQGSWTPQDVVLQNFTYASGPLGDFYHGSSDLADRGSRSVSEADLVGYTTQADQTLDTGTVDIGFHYAINSPPVAYDASAQTCPNQAVSVTLSGYAPSGRSLTFLKVTDPQHGSLGTITPLDPTSASVLYTPENGFCGADAFTFKVNDGLYDSAAATVTVHVGDPNPQAHCQDVMTGVNTPVSFTLSGSDSCGTLTFALQTEPEHGQITHFDPQTGEVTYEPENNFQGADGFWFSVATCTGGSPWQRVVINVVPPPWLEAECRHNRIVLRWRVPQWLENLYGDGFFQSLNIYRCEVPTGSSDCDPIALYQIITETQRRDWDDLSVLPATKYCYRISFTHRNSCDGLTVYESPRSEPACAQLCPPPPPYLGPIDVAIILDNTGSMGVGPCTQLLQDMEQVLDDIAFLSGNDYRLALVTPDDDQVNVRLSFSDRNREDFAAEMYALDCGTPGGGGELPESTDECLNTIINALPASGRSNPRNCEPRMTPLQLNDFIPSFRPDAKKFVVVITDAEPGGFCDVGDNGSMAHQYALQAQTNCIRINAIQIDAFWGRDEARAVMEDYQQTTCGWYDFLPHSGQGIGEAISRMFFVPGYCICP